MMKTSSVLALSFITTPLVFALVIFRQLVHTMKDVSNNKAAEADIKAKHLVSLNVTFSAKISGSVSVICFLHVIFFYFSSKGIFIAMGCSLVGP